MKFTQRKPCNQCPFRKKSAPGWLGDSTPEEFMATTMSDQLMPCHKTVDYADPKWAEGMIASETVQHCVGARIFFKNQCKMTRNPVIYEMTKLGRIPDVKPSDEVFKFPTEFLAHHNHGPLTKKSKPT